MTDSQNPQSPETSPNRAHPELVEPQAAEGQRFGTSPPPTFRQAQCERGDGPVHPQPRPARTASAHQHWTPPRMRYFLSRLADTGNVLGVCREMGLSRQSVYALRARDAAFARAWQGAMLRHRDALVDLCLERATVGVTEEVVIDGQLAERIKPDGAMLRHMLARADRRCDDDSLAARPVQQSERHFEALLDCLDPPMDKDGAGCAAAETPDRDALLADIDASAKWDWKEGEAAEPDHAFRGLFSAEDGAGSDAADGGRADGPCGYASDAEAADALIAYKRIMATPPDKVDTADLDPAKADDWSDEQWLRADRSGLVDTMFGAQAEQEGAGERAGDDAGGDGEAAPEREPEGDGAAGEDDP